MSASNEPTFMAPPPPPQPKEEPKGRRPAKLMIVGIVVFGLGVLVLLAGVAKLIGGGVFTGAALCFGGVILVVLSFVRLPAIPEKEGPLSLVQKVTGIFFEPSRVFRNLREHPHWIGAYAIICVLTTVYSFAFIQRITPERVVDHTIQKMSEMGPPFAPPPEQLENIKNQQLQGLKNPAERVGGFVRSWVGLLILSAIVAGLSMEDQRTNAKPTHLFRLRTPLGDLDQMERAGAARRAGRRLPPRRIRLAARGLNANDLLPIHCPGPGPAAAREGLP